jgi:hypothetical protein
MVVRIRLAGCAALGMALMLAPGCGDSESDDDADGAAGDAGASATDGGSAGTRAASGGQAESGSGPSAGKSSGSAGASAGGTATGGKSGGNEGGTGAEGAESAGGSGTAGSPTSGSGGSGGSGGAAVVGMHCEPGEVIATFTSDIDNPCYGDRWSHGLPNASDVQLSDFRLDTPAAAGERMAVSVRTDGLGPFNVELWGTNAECGVAEELLWWGPMVEGIQCAEFTPTSTYSHLLYVYRKLRNESYSFSAPELALCQGGSCPGGADGEGLEPGGTLEGPPPIYNRTGSEFLRHGFDLELGAFARMVLLMDDYKQPRGTTNQITRGFVRMQADDPFGDAWYCVGEGSTYLESEDEEEDTASVSLKNLTRLPDCDALPGSSSIEITLADFVADITSSLDLAGTGISADAQECWGDYRYCTFRFHETDSTLLWGYRWLHLTPAASVGDNFEPTAVPTDVSEARLFFEPNPGDPLRITCATAGSITYDPENTTSIELDPASDYFACPGEPVENDTFEFSIKPP